MPRSSNCRSVRIPARPPSSPKRTAGLDRGEGRRVAFQGGHKTYTEENLRYSQTVALDMYKEINTGTNLPAQIDICATDGDYYKFLFMAKGGGSANKTMLYQETKALSTRKSWRSTWSRK